MFLKDNQWSVSSLFIYFIPQSYSSERWTWAIFVTRFHTKHPQVEIINKAPLPKDSSLLALSPPLELFLISVPQAQHRGCNLCAGRPSSLALPACSGRRQCVCTQFPPLTYLCPSPSASSCPPCHPSSFGKGRPAESTPLRGSI